MDKLDTIFEMQAKLNEYIIEKRKLEFTKEEWIQKRILAMIDETAELLNEINYKWWKNPKPIDESAVKEEIVDILHFFIGICIDAGMTADELFEIYLNKNKENYLRQQGLSEKKGYEISDKK